MIKSSLYVDMMLKHWFSRPFAPIVPGAPFTAFGDIHGCLDLLTRGLEQSDGQIVCVGDYVDRGPNSAGVLALLQTRPDIICLMGNHEDMLLSFLDDPLTHGPRWLTFGGALTLDSYGVSQKGTATQMRDALRMAMGPKTERWLRALPSYWQSGNVVVTHAGADPGQPIETQAPQVLRWGHPKFRTRRRNDGLWVLCGHVVVDTPQAKHGIIEIDTGAFRTGQLTLARIKAGGVEFRTA